jgi:hypothetical protein
MPSKSKKQHNLMEAVAHNAAFAKKVGISQSVGQDFASADKGRKFSKGGDMKAKMSMKKFEASSKDMEKGMKEGSKKDMMADKAMMGYKKAEQRSVVKALPSVVMQAAEKYRPYRFVA